jgi:UDP-N-acetylglucosamine:LPS N-acetylglucosamine transferase
VAVRAHIGQLRVLVVSASVGAGDAGNARELARRLGERGHDVVVEDFLTAAPLGIGKALCKGYEAELRHAPWAYELAFGVWYWCPFLMAPLARFLSLFTRRKILRWVRQTRADVVVVTYPIATQVLGDLRRRARRRLRKRSSLQVPAVNFITDFGYHPFWGHKNIDLNLAVHPSTVDAVARHTGRPSIACEPLVGPEFGAARQRRDTQRAALGLDDTEVAALISSGSWGVGSVRETLELLASRPGLVPVVACGRNAALQRQLEQLVETHRYRAVVLGWTDDMPGLMAACDVLVENAGGLTSLEAMRAGLPMVSFRPIPGHGRKSAATMDSAGVSYLAHDGDELVAQLNLLGRPGPARQAQLDAAAGLFTADASVAVAAIGSSGVPRRIHLRPPVRVARAGASVFLAGALAWVGLTTGVGVAAAAGGAGVAHPPAGANWLVYVGVRLGPLELSSSVVRDELAQLGGSAVLDVSTASTEPGAVEDLAARGVNVESGGFGFGPGRTGGDHAPWSMAWRDTRSVRELSALTGQPVGIFVPDRSLSAFDLVDARSAHVVMVVPNTTLPIAPSGPFPRQQLALPPLQGGQIYVVNGQVLPPAQLSVLLEGLRFEIATQRLASAPLSALQ